MKHFHFIVQAYQQETPTGGLSDVCTIDVFASGEQEAIKRAQQLVRKKHYRVSSVIEHDPVQEER